MSTIKVPDTISKLNPDDTYPVVEGPDVGGFIELKQEVNNNTSKIETNITNVNNLSKAGKTLVKKVVGDTPPDYGKEPHGNYITTVRAMTKRMDLTTPNPTGGMIDGSIFTVFNEDPTDSIMIRAGNSLDKVNGSSGVNVPPENFSSFVYQLADRNFLLLESGYIPAARVNVANFVEQKLSSDDKLHTTAEIKAMVSGGVASGVDIDVDDSKYQAMKTLEFEDFTAEVDLNDPKKLILTAPKGAGTDLGITVDDGTSNFSDVSLIKLKGIKASRPDGDSIDSVTLNAMSSWSTLGDPTYGGEANSVLVEPPLQVFADPDSEDTNRLRLEPGTFEGIHAPGYLAYFDSSVGIVGKTSKALSHADGAVYPTDVVVDNGTYIVKDKKSKAIGLQEADQGDPNVTGGTDYLVAFRVSLEDKAPGDGFVQIYLAEKAEFGQPVKLLTDVNGSPLAVQRYYHKDDELGELEIIGIVNAKGLKEFTMHVVDSFDNEIINISPRSKGVSGVMVQAILDTSKTGLASAQYEIDTEQNIEFTRYYMGDDMLNIDWLSKYDMPISEGSGGEGAVFPDGIYLNNISNLNVGIVDKRIVIKDNGSNVVDFVFGKTEDAMTTYAMRGKTLAVKLAITNKDSAFRVALMKWTGKPDQYDKNIFNSRNNGSPIFLSGWAQVDSLFISEDVANEDREITHEFTVPSDAVNYAVVIYPESEQQPLELKLKTFNAGSKVPFYFYDIHSSRKLSEIHLAFDKRFYESEQGAKDLYSLRYTIGDQADGYPMPCGDQVSGKADITLDPTVNQVPGSGASGGEGALKFGKDGEVTINTLLNIRSEQAKGTNHPTSFWWAKVDANGAMAEIKESKTTFPISGDSSGIYPMKELTMSVKAGDRIALRAKSDMPDGAYLEADNGKSPLVDVKINFDELVQDTSDDPFADIDLSQFDRVYTGTMTATKFVSNSASVTFNLDIPDGFNVSVIEAVKQSVSDGFVRPVRNLDWAYSNKDKTLKVSFGETVDIGAVTIGVYV
ncbi:hypothetical protein [Vibrio phage vB_VpM-pA2SJ1]|uniref:Tail fiber protein n=1 Tax=Vibrio phage vB_VpM-pA2SJ1 TaxID=3095964 RepID=A0AAX4J5W5_9CAUD